MYIFHRQDELKAYLENIKTGKHGIGFVPTMGALHSGHLKLIQEAKKNNTTVVCSIFVNPTQFNNADDLKRYPRTTSADIEKLSPTGCDVLYLPEVTDIYPQGTELKVQYDIGTLDTILEGAFRPGHFQGVTQVVDNLLQVVHPDDLYLGQKDYQQCMVLKRLITTKAYPVKIHFVPTQREADGLAMSSRNQRLTEPQRATANIIYQCLVSIQSKEGEGSFPVVKKECWELLEHKGFRPEYIELANADTLEIMDDYDTSVEMVALIAAYLGDIRLIDNMFI